MPPPRPTGTFAPPVSPLVVTSSYGIREIKRGTDFHEGVDFRARTPVPVSAMDGGTVLFAGARRPADGFGNRVIIDHGNGIVSVYAHLSAVSVSAGAEVQQGERIATSGNTGASEHPHLHVEVNAGGDIDLYRQGAVRYEGARHFDARPYVGTGVAYGREANLQRGDDMPAVRELQQDLVARGYDLRVPGRPGDGVDGNFGGATQAALVAFQRDRGMPAAQQTGIYGPITRAEMAEAERTNWQRPGTPQTDLPVSTPTTAPQTVAPQTTPAPQAVPNSGAERFIDTAGPYAAVSTGALLGTQTGTRLGALTADQSYALGRAIAGDGPGAAALEAVDRRFGTGSGVFVQRVLAMGQHEGGLDFGRRNPDPGTGPNDRTAGYDFGTFQVGGRGTGQASTAANFERYLGRGIQIYRGLEPGAQVDRATLTVADRDILAHIGYMAARGTEAFGTPLPENEILRRMADPTIQGDDLAFVVRNDVQGGIPKIGAAVVRMTSPTEGLRVDLAAVEARGREPDALRREPSMPVFNQALALKNSEKGPVYSPAVETWQRVLQARGLDVGPNGPDGVYGGATLRSTQALQTQAGLPARPSGNVGPQTWAAYADTGARTVEGGPTTPRPAAPPRPDVPSRDSASVPRGEHPEITQTLREGDRGEQVTILQKHLQTLGYPLGRTGPAGDGVDGVFGPQTRRAVETLQRDSALTVDGVVGRDTRAPDVLHPIYIDAVPASALTSPVPGTTPAPTPTAPVVQAPAQVPAGPGGDGAQSPAGPPVATVPTPPARLVDPRLAQMSSDFVRQADQVISDTMSRNTLDAPGALAALVRDTRGPGSGPLGATTAADVQQSFARFASEADPRARPLSDVQASQIGRVLDERSRVVGESQGAIDGAPTPLPAGQVPTPSIAAPAVTPAESPSRLLTPTGPER